MFRMGFDVSNGYGTGQSIIYGANRTFFKIITEVTKDFESHEGETAFEEEVNELGRWYIHRSQMSLKCGWKKE
jgi:hypothetical protein